MTPRIGHDDVLEDVELAPALAQVEPDARQVHRDVHEGEQQPDHRAEPDVDVQRTAARERVIGQDEAQCERDDEAEYRLEVDRVDR